jgi:hypothetical protein
VAQVKKSVTLDADVVRDIERLVGPRRFSAFMNESAKLRLLVARGQEAVSRYEEQHGPIADDDLAAVDQKWPE